MTTAEAVELKRRVAEKLAKLRDERATAQPDPPPRYDDVFFQGVAWLDDLDREQP